MVRLGVMVLLLGVLAGCSDDTTAPARPSEPSTVGDDGLTLARDGGDTIEFRDAVAECLTSDDGDGDVEIVRLTGPQSVRFDPNSGKPSEPFFYVEVIPGVEGRQVLPLEQKTHSEGPSDVVVFSADPEGPSENSAGQGDSTGQITIIDATCDPVAHLAFTIEATIGSEFSDGRSVTLDGGLEATGTSD